MYDERQRQASSPEEEPRVARVSIPASKSKPGFVLKPTGAGGPKPELPPNPVVERFREPLPPSPLERLLPVIKGVTVGLTVLLLLLVALYFIPLPAAGDIASLSRATKVLATVKAVPTQHEPILMLKEATLPLRGTANPGVVAALLAVVALGEVRTGDRTTGLRQCDYIVNTYTGAPAAQLVGIKALSEQCRKCGGTGRVAEPLKPGSGVRPIEGDTVLCLKCQGKGMILSDNAIDAQYAAALAAAEAEIARARSRGGAVMSFLLRIQHGLHKAFGKTPADTATQRTQGG